MSLIAFSLTVNGASKSVFLFLPATDQCYYCRLNFEVESVNTCDAAASGPAVPFRGAVSPLASYA